MPRKRSQIDYVITIYITAHGRAETETDTFIDLGERDVYVGQETGNCGIQSKQHDRQLLETVTNWNNVAAWLKTGAHVSSIEHADYKIGPYMYEDQGKVVYNATTAIVGPMQKKNKIMDMEGRVGEISRPGIAILIQERETKNATLEKSMVRNFLNKIYTRGSSELKRDQTGMGHRFSAIYINNQMLEPNHRTPNNILSSEFNDFVTSNAELGLDDIIKTCKMYASRIINLKPNNKKILYTIADTTCNVYATEDIVELPAADQDETTNVKSSRKAKSLAKFFGTNIGPLIKNVDPEIVAVTPSHESGFWFTMRPDSQRLRMRPSDKPAKEIKDSIDDTEEIVTDDEPDVSEVDADPYYPFSTEYPELSKPTRKKAPKKKHHGKKRNIQKKCSEYGTSTTNKNYRNSKKPKKGNQCYEKF